MHGWKCEKRKWLHGPLPSSGKSPLCGSTFLVILFIQYNNIHSFHTGFFFDSCTNNCITRKLIAIDLLAILSIRTFREIPSQEDTIWVPAFVKYTICAHTATLTSSPCSIVMKDFLVCTYSRNLAYTVNKQRQTCEASRCTSEEGEMPAWSSHESDNPKEELNRKPGIIIDSTVSRMYAIARTII